MPIDYPTVSLAYQPSIRQKLIVGGAVVALHGTMVWVLLTVQPTVEEPATPPVKPLDIQFIKAKPTPTINSNVTQALDTNQANAEQLTPLPETTQIPTAEPNQAATAQIDNKATTQAPPIPKTDSLNNLQPTQQTSNQADSQNNNQSTSQPNSRTDDPADTAITTDTQTANSSHSAQSTEPSLNTPPVEPTTQSNALAMSPATDYFAIQDAGPTGKSGDSRDSSNSSEPVPFAHELEKQQAVSVVTVMPTDVKPTSTPSNSAATNRQTPAKSTAISRTQPTTVANNPINVSKTATTKPNTAQTNASKNPSQTTTNQPRKTDTSLNSSMTTATAIGQTSPVTTTTNTNTTNKSSAKESSVKQFPKQSYNQANRSVTLATGTSATDNKVADFSAGEIDWVKKPVHKFPDNVQANARQVFEVTLKLLIDKKGYIESISIAKSSGNTVIDNTAKSQTRYGRVTPFAPNGVTVKGNVNYTVIYKR